MCRGLRDSWEAEDAAERVVALQLGVQAIESALESARRLNQHDPTVATARAEVALARALALCEPEEPARVALPRTPR
jgi:hypothetical protein